MAYEINAASEGLTRVAAGPDIYPITSFIRVKRNGSGGASGERIVMLWDAASTGLRWAFLTTGIPVATVNTGGSATGAAAVTDGLWYDVIVTLAGTGGTDLRLQYGLSGDGTLASSTGAGPTGPKTTDRQYLGNEAATLYPNSTLDDFRLWSAVLTDEEIARERLRRAPQRLTNLEMWVPMLGRTSADVGLDFSGNARNLTPNGTPAYVDGASIGWGLQPIFYGAFSSAGGGGATAFQVNAF